MFFLAVRELEDIITEENFITFSMILPSEKCLVKNYNFSYEKKRKDGELNFRKDSREYHLSLSDLEPIGSGKFKYTIRNLHPFSNYDYCITPNVDGGVEVCQHTVTDEGGEEEIIVSSKENKTNLQSYEYQNN